jgi:hypothetical protein
MRKDISIAVVAIVLLSAATVTAKTRADYCAAGEVVTGLDGYGSIVCDATISLDIDALWAALKQEVQDRTDADAAEAVLRSKADSGLAADLASEAVKREAADSALQANIDAEEAARIAADNGLAADLATESADRSAGDAKMLAAAQAYADSNDDDTTYDGTDFALSNQGCSAGDVVTGVDASGNVICNLDADTIYTDAQAIEAVGPHTVDTDTTLDQAGVEALGFVTGPHTVVHGNGVNCPPGHYAIGVDANGNAEGCTPEINTDTQLTEAQVDNYVANNGYLTKGNVYTVSDTRTNRVYCNELSDVVIGGGAACNTADNLKISRPLPIELPNPASWQAVCQSSRNSLYECGETHLCVERYHLYTAEAPLAIHVICLRQ